VIDLALADYTELVDRGQADADTSDSIARHLLRDAIIYVMPNVCPDGTW
jgi:hypothetical protein